MTIDNVAITVSLASDELACGACGIAVAGPHDKADVTVHAASKRLRGPEQAVGAHFETSFTHCQRCRDLLAQAEQIAPLLRFQGSRSIAVERVKNALDALDALGRPVPKIMTAREARMLVNQLSAAGGAVRWSRAFTGVMESSADQKAANVSRWAHLTGEQKTMLREAGADYMRVRIEKPKQFAPPAGGRACALCGVGSLTALPSQSHLLWTRIGSDKYTCPACSTALDSPELSSPTIGETAAELALRAHLGIPRRGPFSGHEFKGLTPWLHSGAKPNKKPWQHLDLDAVGKLLDSPF